MDYKAARSAMIDGQLSTNNVFFPSLLSAIQEVPREEFVPEHKKNTAYLDEDILLGEGRWLMEPMIFGRLVQALEPKLSEVVLDVGGGSGYSAAVLSYLTETVIAVEPTVPLMDHARKVWRKMNICNIADLQEDIEEAAAAHAPYDMILMNGAVAEIPEDLVALLKEDTGRLACVYRPDPQANGSAMLVKKLKSGGCSEVELFDANVPYITEYKPQKDFSF